MDEFLTKMFKTITETLALKLPHLEQEAIRFLVILVTSPMRYGEEGGRRMEEGGRRKEEEEKEEEEGGRRGRGGEEEGRTQRKSTSEKQ